MPLLIGFFGNPVDAVRAGTDAAAERRAVSVVPPVKKAVRFPNSDGETWSSWDKATLLKGDTVFPHGSYDTGNCLLNFIGNAFCQGNPKHADGFAITRSGNTLTVQYVKGCLSNLRHYGLQGDTTTIRDSSNEVNHSFNIVKQEITEAQFYALARERFPYCAGIHPSYIAAGKAEAVANGVAVPVAASAIPVAGASAAGAINSAAAVGSAPELKA